MSVQSSNFLTKFFIPTQQDMPERRYDLDWLRILVFGLLIFIILACCMLQVGAFISKALINQSYSQISCLLLNLGEWHLYG